METIQSEQQCIARRLSPTRLEGMETAASRVLGPRTPSSPTRLEGMETSHVENFLKALTASLRPALRGWKLGFDADGFFAYRKSPTRLEGMETIPHHHQLRCVLRLRPALRGWKLVTLTVYDTDLIGLRPALRGWKPNLSQLKSHTKFLVSDPP